MASSLRRRIVLYASGSDRRRLHRELEDFLDSYGDVLTSSLHGGISEIELWTSLSAEALLAAIVERFRFSGTVTVDGHEATRREVSA